MNSIVKLASFVGGLGLGMLAAPRVQAVEIVPEPVLSAQGLHRVWVTRVEVNPSRGKIEYLTYHDGLIIAQTSTGTVQTIDAETGRTLWTAHPGKSRYPVSSAGINSWAVAVCNGVTLYVLDRRTGFTVMEKDLETTPSAGCTMSENHVYIPLMNGAVKSYPLYRVVESKPAAETAEAAAPKGKGEKAAKPPAAPKTETAPEAGTEAGTEPEPSKGWSDAPKVDKSTGTGKKSQALYSILGSRRNREQTNGFNGQGICDEAPVVADFVVAWGTDSGNVYSASRFDMRPLFRYRTRGAVTAPLTFRRPYIVGASRDGYVFALREQSGSPRWQFSSGDPVVHAPVICGDSVYVISEMGSMYQLDLDRGQEKWFAPNVSKFISATPSRVYVVDRLGRLVMLDPKSGSRLGSIPVGQVEMVVTNSVNDRLFLASRSGVIQGLRETALVKPLAHPTPALIDPAEAKKGDKGKSKPQGWKPDAAGSEEPADGSVDSTEGEDTADESADEAASEEPKAEGDKPAAEKPEGGLPDDENPFDDAEAEEEADATT